MYIMEHQRRGPSAGFNDIDRGSGVCFSRYESYRHCLPTFDTKSQTVPSGNLT